MAGTLREFEDARPLLTGTLRLHCGREIGKNLKALRERQTEAGIRHASTQPSNSVSLDRNAATAINCVAPSFREEASVDQFIFLKLYEATKDFDTVTKTLCGELGHPKDCEECTSCHFCRWGPFLSPRWDFISSSLAGAHFGAPFAFWAPQAEDE